jgi:hypothetical protein
MVGVRRRENPEQRKLWLRSLRVFKLGIQVRAKMGVVEKYCQQVAAQRLGDRWSTPDWSNDKWITLLYTSIRDTQYPPELMIGFAESVQLRFEDIPNKQPSVAATLDVINYVCKVSSYELRRRFKVFYYE